MLSSDWSRMGSCPASKTMYYNISSGGSRGREEAGEKLEDGEIEREVVKLQRKLVKQQLSGGSH